MARGFTFKVLRWPAPVGRSKIPSRSFPPRSGNLIRQFSRINSVRTHQRKPASGCMASRCCRLTGPIIFLLAWSANAVPFIGTARKPVLAAARLTHAQSRDGPIKPTLGRTSLARLPPAPLIARQRIQELQKPWPALGAPSNPQPLTTLQFLTGARSTIPQSRGNKHGNQQK